MSLGEVLDNEGNKKILRPTDYGANDENTLKIGMRQQTPMNPALRNPNVLIKIIASFNCYGLGPAESVLQNKWNIMTW